jgi:prefoldin subunit 5
MNYTALVEQLRAWATELEYVTPATVNDGDRLRSVRAGLHEVANDLADATEALDDRIVALGQARTALGGKIGELEARIRALEDEP